MYIPVCIVYFLLTLIVVVTVKLAGASWLVTLLVGAIMVLIFAVIALAKSLPRWPG